jgi:hypothetical protein
MKNKKAIIAIGKIIALILVILVILATILGLTRFNLLDQINILPEYTSPEDPSRDTGPDEVIDACPKIGKIIEEVIYLNGEKTDFFWKGAKDFAGIKTEKGRNLIVGEVIFKKVYIRQNYLVKDSRESKELIDKFGEKGFSDLQKINNLYNAGGNILCQSEKSEEIKKVLLNVSLNPIKEENKLGYIIKDLDKYFGFKYLYIREGGNIIKLYGQPIKGSASQIGEIHPNGNLIINGNKISGQNISKEIYFKYTEENPLYPLESNIKINNYYKVFICIKYGICKESGEFDFGSVVFKLLPKKVKDESIINLSNYIKHENIDYLYIYQEDKFIYIEGKPKGWLNKVKELWQPLKFGRISSDGSVWFNKEILENYKVSFKENKVGLIESETGASYTNSNLKVNNFRETFICLLKEIC